MKKDIDVQNLTIDDIKPITISFKKNNEELILYKWILSHSGYSGFVKDTLRTIMEVDKNINMELPRMPRMPRLLQVIPDLYQSSGIVELDSKEVEL